MCVVLGLVAGLFIGAVAVGIYVELTNALVLHTPSHLRDKDVAALVVCDEKADVLPAAAAGQQRREGVWHRVGPRNACGACLETESVYPLRGRLLCPRK